MWKNKHVVVAMLVAPVLAVMAWFAVDHFVGEQPAAAREGAAYSLIAKSNCRYASGQCDLANGNFLLTLFRQTESRGLLLRASHDLDAAVAAMGSEASGFGVERALTRDDMSAASWQFRADQPIVATDTLRLAVTASGSTYYANVPLTFVAAESNAE